MKYLSLIVRALVSKYPQIAEHVAGRYAWIAAAALVTDDADAVKTFEHYLRQIQQAVRGLYMGSISDGDFIGIMAEIIPAQLTKAWNQGMRDNGLDPAYDMLEEWQLELDARILSEYDFVDRFAADILDARETLADGENRLDGLLARAALWANRYNDIYNWAKMATADGTDKYRWVLGATEEHCYQCGALNGIVAFAREWEQSRFTPQTPPNPMLECGGWRCDCRLEKTTARRSPKALDQLIRIAMGR